MLLDTSSPQSSSSSDKAATVAGRFGTAQTLREIHEQIGPASSDLLLTIEAVFDLPDSGIGLLSLCSELVADIRARAHTFPSPELEAWLRDIDHLRQEVRTVTERSAPHDRTTAHTLKLPLTSLMLTYPASSLSPKQEQALCCLRAALCLWHLNTKHRFSREVATSFVRLLKDRPDAETQAILASIPINSAYLKSLRTTFDPGSKAYLFLTHIDSALSAPLLPPPLIRTSEVRITSKSAVKSECETDVDLEGELPSQPKQTNTARDLISANLSRIAFARPKDMAGVTGLPDLAQPAELIAAFSALAQELCGPQRLQSLGAMLATLCNARPRQFNLIPLRRVLEHAIWLDLETGHIYWILEAVTARERYLRTRKAGQTDSLTVVRNPLPRAVFAELCQLFADLPFANTLADLFPIPPEELDKAVKRLLRRLSKSSHHLTVERLRAGYGTFLVGLTQDEALSSAMSMNFCLGTPANLNYWPLRAKRISLVASQVYSALGLSGGLWSSPAFDTGSAQLDCEGELRALVAAFLQDATDAFRRIHLKSSPSDLIFAHNVIATSVFALLLVTTGHRKTREAFARHALDLEHALAILGDKRSSPYHLARVVSLPTITVTGSPSI